MLRHRSIGALVTWIALLAPTGALAAGDALGCFPLTRAHTGSGIDPVAEPESPPGCPSGAYLPGRAEHPDGAAGLWLGSFGLARDRRVSFVDRRDPHDAGSSAPRRGCLHRRSLARRSTVVAEGPGALPVELPIGARDWPAVDIWGRSGPTWSCG